MFHRLRAVAAAPLAIPRWIPAAASILLPVLFSVVTAFGQCTTNGVASSCTLTGPVTVSSYSAGIGTTTTASGAITTTGPVVFTGGQGSNTILNLQADTTLIGAGTFTLSSAGGNGQQFIDQTNSGVTLTNQSTLQGTGVVGNSGLSFLNSGSGVVNANANGLILLFNGTGSMTNQGLMEATGGGILNISSGPVNNAGGNITADGGSVVIQSSAIQGGTLTAKNGGTLSTLGSSFLDGTVGASGITVSAGTTYLNDVGNTTSIAGTLTNNGTLVVNGGNGNNGVLGLNANTTLTGNGTLTLGYVGGNGSAYVQQNVGGLTLTNLNNLIQGAGTIGNGGLTFINNSIVNANSNGNTLILNGSGGVTNTSLLEATNGGILQVSTNVANQGANISAVGTGAVNFGGVTVTGGTINGANLTSANTSFDGSTTGNPITLSSGSTLTTTLGTNTYLAGTINNKGTLSLTGGNGSNTVLQFYGGAANATNLTLQGGGTVTLGYSGGNGAAIIQQNTGGLTLTNVDNLIQGTGTIGNGGLTFINQSTVNANSNGNALTLNGSGGVTNSSLIEATNGGILQISTNVANQGANITADAASAVNFSNVTVTGGTISGAKLTSANTSFDGSTAIQ